jgi:hypothetical protein
MQDIRFNPPEVEETPNENLNGEENKKKKTPFDFSKWFKKSLKFLGGVLVLAVVVLLVFFGRGIFHKIFKPANEVYSAVFLTNDQVYFGVMVGNNETEITLNNVYYIQVNEKAISENPASALNQASFNLVKLGNELHGPTDELFINKAQVVFYEKLRDDSKVVESIKSYK